MNSIKDNEKVSLIKKFYKKDEVFLELELLNYSGYNLYIIITRSKKYGTYKLSWFDLDDIKDKSIEKYLSCQYIDSKVIHLIENTYSNYKVDAHYIDEFLTDKDVVIFNANIKTNDSDNISISFKKYMPKCLANLTDLFIFIFRNMPRTYEVFLYKILAKLTGSTEMYEYKEEFDFDLFNDDIDKLFRFQIVERGKKYYEEDRVEFLEKIDDRYFAIVNGSEKYVVIIKYIEKDKKMQVYCTCPCEFYCKHIYAVILAIRNNKGNRFYKIMYKNPNKNLLERIMDLEYLLCLGIIEQNFEIINNYGEIELIPILDKNDKYNWEILEDSEDEKLTKQIKYFLDNK